MENALISLAENLRGAEGFIVPPLLLVCNHTHKFCMQETYTQSLYVIVSIQNTTYDFWARFHSSLFLENQLSSFCGVIA
jgi:hypothetical protein